jgi:hypothetical protein
MAEQGLELPEGGPPSDGGGSGEPPSAPPQPSGDMQEAFEACQELAPEGGLGPPGAGPPGFGPPEGAQSQ